MIAERGQMSGWRIVEWSRELGRGRIESEAGSLDFDGAVALCDDFAIGEPVEIQLERTPDGWSRVRRVAPLSYRSALPAFDELSPGWIAELAVLNRLIAGSLVRLLLLEANDDRLRLEVQHSEWPPPSMPLLGEAVFLDVAYIHLPTSSDTFHHVRAVPVGVARRERPELLEHLAVELDELDPDAVLVSFEPSGFGEKPGYLIARAIQVRAGS